MNPVKEHLLHSYPLIIYQVNQVPILLTRSDVRPTSPSLAAPSLFSFWTPGMSPQIWHFWLIHAWLTFWDSWEQINITLMGGKFYFLSCPFRNFRGFKKCNFWRGLGWKKQNWHQSPALQKEAYLPCPPTNHICKTHSGSATHQAGRQLHSWAVLGSHPWLW